MHTRLRADVGIALIVGAAAWASAMTASASPRTGPAGGAAAPARAPVARAAVRSIAISGVAWEADSRAIPGARLRLRDVVSGRVAALAVADQTGRFTFTGVEGGSYLIELVNPAGKILAVGHTFSVGPGETVATFVRLAAKSPWFSGFFGNAASAVASTAASAGVTALAPETRPCASPSPGCV